MRSAINEGEIPSKGENMTLVQAKAFRNEASWYTCVTPGCYLMWLEYIRQVWGDMMEAGPQSWRILYVRKHNGTKFQTYTD